MVCSFLYSKNQVWWLFFFALAHKIVASEVSSEPYAFKELYLYSSIYACSLTGKILYFPGFYGVISVDSPCNLSTDFQSHSWQVAVLPWTFSKDAALPTSSKESLRCTAENFCHSLFVVGVLLAVGSFQPMWITALVAVPCKGSYWLGALEPAEFPVRLTVTLEINILCFHCCFYLHIPDKGCCGEIHNCGVSNSDLRQQIKCGR